MIEPCGQSELPLSRVAASLAVVLRDHSDVNLSFQRPRCEFKTQKNLADAAVALLSLLHAGMDKSSFSRVRRDILERASSKPVSGLTLEHLIDVIEYSALLPNEIFRRLPDGFWGHVESQVVANLSSKRLFELSAQRSRTSASPPQSIVRTVSSMSLPSPVSTAGTPCSSENRLTPTRLRFNSFGDEGETASLAALTDLSVDQKLALVATNKSDSQTQHCGDLSLETCLRLVQSGNKEQLAQLVLTLHSANAHGEVQSHSLTKERRKRQYYVRKVKGLKEQLVAANEEIRQLRNGVVMVSKRRKTNAKRWRLSLQGGYRLALARNAGHAGCEAALKMLDADSQRSVCAYWEHMLSSSLQTDCFKWYSDRHDLLQNLDTATSTIPSFEIHSFRGDATNSSVVQSHKVHTCQVMSTFQYPSQESSENECGFSIDWRVSFADLQFLPASSGQILHDVYVKHIKRH